MMLAVCDELKKLECAREYVGDGQQKQKDSDRVQKNCPRTAIEKSAGNAGYSGPAGDLAFNERESRDCKGGAKRSY